MWSLRRSKGDVLPHDTDFSENDLALIRAMPQATVGGGMIFPSGLKTTEQVIVLGGNFRDNIELCRSILQR